jgi:hypothetical protein
VRKHRRGKTSGTTAKRRKKPTPPVVSGKRGSGATALQLPANASSPVEPSIKELMTAPPDLLREDECDIEENVSFGPKEGGPAPLRVHFDASAARAPCGKIRSWSWSFGDGIRASGKRVTHIYSKTGTYIARVNITDSKGFTNLVEIEYLINVHDR